jgi:hypothetical protein
VRADIERLRKEAEEQGYRLLVESQAFTDAAASFASSLEQEQLRRSGLLGQAGAGGVGISGEELKGI